MAISEITRTLQLLSCDFCGTVHISEKEARAHGCLSPPPKQKFTVGEKVFVTVCVGDRPPRNIACRVTSIRSPVAAGWRPEHRLPVSRCTDGGRNHIAVSLSSHVHDWVITVDSEEDPVSVHDEVCRDAILLPEYAQNDVHPRRDIDKTFEPLSIRPSLRGPVSIRNAEMPSGPVSQTRILSVPPLARPETPTLPCAAW